MASFEYEALIQATKKPTAKGFLEEGDTAKREINQEAMSIERMMQEAFIQDPDAVRELSIRFARDQYHDVLTGCFNRRYVMERLEYALNTQKRTLKPVSLLMGDLGTRFQWKEKDLGLRLCNIRFFPVIRI